MTIPTPPAKVSTAIAARTAAGVTSSLLATALATPASTRPSDGRRSCAQPARVNDRRLGAGGGTGAVVGTGAEPL